MTKLARNSVDKLSEISDTMLITLYSRARETLSPSPIIQDQRAVEMIKIFKEELAGSNKSIHQKIIKDTYNPKLAVTMALRSRRFDLYVKDFLDCHPAGTVVNFGCGLDTRFDRMDNRKVHWFDIDFPSVIELRRRFIPENDRHHFIGCSILEPDWMDEIKTGNPILFIAEGVFMYLQEDQVKNLLFMLKDNFEPSELVCEVSNSYWVSKMSSPWLKWKFKHQLGMQEKAAFSFGIPDSRYFESWDPSFKFIDEWTYFDDREKKLGLINLMGSINLFRKIQWTIHYSIG